MEGRSRGWAVGAGQTGLVRPAGHGNGMEGLDRSGASGDALEQQVLFERQVHAREGQGHLKSPRCSYDKAAERPAVAQHLAYVGFFVEDQVGRQRHGGATLGHLQENGTAQSSNTLHQSCMESVKTSTKPG